MKHLPILTDNIYNSSTRNLDLHDEEWGDVLAQKERISHDPKHHDCPLPSPPRSPNTSLQSEQWQCANMSAHVELSVPVQI